jgi:hypothetical protein
MDAVADAAEDAFQEPWSVVLARNDRDFVIPRARLWAEGYYTNSSKRQWQEFSSFRYSRSLMESLAEISIVAGVMLPGMTTVIIALYSQRPLSAVVWASFSVGLGLLATGILILRRWPTNLLAEAFIVIGAMLPGVATVILEVSLRRPLSVIVGISLSVAAGLVALGILVLHRLKPPQERWYCKRAGFSAAPKSSIVNRRTMSIDLWSVSTFIPSD